MYLEWCYWNGTISDPPSNLLINGSFPFYFQDIYVLFCMIFQCVMVVQNSVASVLVNGEDFSRARLFDWICALVLLFCLVSFHVIMGSIVFFGVRIKYRLHPYFLSS